MAVNRPVFGTSVPTGYARLTPDGDALAFTSSYSGELVEALKRQIPSEARRWDKQYRRWLISSQYATVCVALCRAYLNLDLVVPKVSHSVTVEIRLLALEYLGRAKNRGDSSYATGYVDGDWSAIFPEDVLRTWFDTPRMPNEQKTLYMVLAVKETATDPEIKTSYRRLVMQWHPDRCKEPDAAEQFKAIQHAYEILSEPLTRRKYDAGLWFERQEQRSIASSNELGRTEVLNGEPTYCAPYRCGYVLAEGTLSLGRFIVAKIIDWQDVLDAKGRTMVSSWHKGDDHFTVTWG